jgi:hypothetical protein
MRRILKEWPERSERLDSLVNKYRKDSSLYATLTDSLNQLKEIIRRKTLGNIDTPPLQPSPETSPEERVFPPTTPCGTLFGLTRL